MVSFLAQVSECVPNAISQAGDRLGRGALILALEVVHDHSMNHRPRHTHIGLRLLALGQSTKEHGQQVDQAFVLRLRA